MQYGKVQKFDVLKGFGFILQSFKTRFYFHVTNWKSEVPPQVGMKVQFDTAPGKRAGLPDQAIDVSPLAGAQ